MPTVSDLQENQRNAVRKHGNQLFAVSPVSVTPFVERATMFDTTGLPVLPEGVKIMGYITTDGISEDVEMSTNPTNMIQDLEPVREDTEELTRTLAINFGEANNWTAAMRAGVPVEDWPESKSSDIDVVYGEVSEYPYFRGYILTQDGVGEAARYRYEVLPLTRVISLESRVLNRTDPETYGVTLKAFKDSDLGMSYVQRESGVLVPIGQQP